MNDRTTQNSRNIRLNRKLPKLARKHLYTVQTTIKRVLANNEYANSVPVISITSLYQILVKSVLSLLYRYTPHF